MIGKSFGIALILAGVSQFASAGVFTAPELDPATGVSGLVLLSGALLILRARRRKS
jgi:LPXTG-motif cell wall-anchored protein